MRQGVRIDRETKLRILRMRRQAQERQAEGGSMKEIIEKIDKLPDGRDVCMVGFHGGELDAECHIGSTDELKALAQFARDAAEAIRKMDSAMDMQEKRQSEEFHIPAPTAWVIWSAAREKGQAALAKHAELLKETK
jgi:hypothetical protein